jgi:hypothetical protein
LVDAALKICNAFLEVPSIINGNVKKTCCSIVVSGVVSNGSTVVEYMTTNPDVEGSNPASAWYH